MRREGVKPAPAKAGKRVSWAGENREVPSLAFDLTVPVQRKLPVSVLTVLPQRTDANYLDLFVEYPYRI